MIDKQLVEKKLRRIEQFMRELETTSFDTLEEFQSDLVRKRFIERNIELAVEQVMDICRHLVAGLNLREPETYADCFDILHEQKIIPAESLDIFKSMARYRNLLIHAYDGIDDAVTYGIYKQKLGDFRRYIEIMRRYMASG